MTSPDTTQHKKTQPHPIKAKPEAKPQSAHSVLPETGFVRLKTIIGDPNGEPPTPAVIPVSASAWWKGVKEGHYPKPVKLSPGCTAWRVEDIRTLIQSKVV